MHRFTFGACADWSHWWEQTADAARLPRSQEVPPLALNRGQQLRRGSLTHTMLPRSHVQDFNYAPLLLSLWMLKRARARAYITFTTGERNQAAFWILSVFR